MNEKLTEYEIAEPDALIFQERVELGQKEVSKKMRQQHRKSKPEDETIL